MLNWFKQLFSSAGQRPSARTHEFSYRYLVPSRLGIRDGLGSDAEGLVQRLDNALKESFLRQVQSRVQSRHPEINHAKYGWMELEMKRFFVLTALIQNVPMYSDDTDLIWHEMLMFTREYQQFCDEFAGFYIHHQPNVNSDSVGMQTQMDERAVFELVYASLFVVAPENQQLLGPFYRRQISPGLMEELQSMDPYRLRAALRFRDSTDPVVLAVQDSVLALIQAQTEQAQSYHDESQLGRQSSYFGGIDPLWTMLAFGMATEMSPFNPWDADHARERDHEASSGSAWVGADSGQDGHGGGHGGHDGGSCSGGGGSSCSSSDGGGSSCSSSSCSSGCGSS